MKNKIILLTVAMVFLLSPLCFAGVLQAPQETFGTDKIAHFAVGYMIDDQLQRHYPELSYLERKLIIAGLTYAKEASDPVFDRKDFGATVLGAVFKDIKVFTIKF